MSTWIKPRARPLEGAAVEAATFLLQPLAPAVVTKVLHSYNLGVAQENRVRAQLERFGDRPIAPRDSAASSVGVNDQQA